MKPKRLQRIIAHHEAGHAVVARLVKVGVELATLKPISGDPCVLTVSASHGDPPT